MSKCFPNIRSSMRIHVRNFLNSKQAINHWKRFFVSSNEDPFEPFESSANWKHINFESTGRQDILQIHTKVPQPCSWVSVSMSTPFLALPSWSLHTVFKHRTVQARKKKNTKTSMSRHQNCWSQICSSQESATLPSFECYQFTKLYIASSEFLR